MKKNWINGKTFIITGASGGIGFAVSKILIENYDCTVIGVARNKEKTLKAKESLGEKKDKFIEYFFDVSSLDSWKSFKDFLEENNFSVDGLINNAGFMLPFSKFTDYKIDEIDEIVKTNFMSILYSIKTLKPLLDKSSTPTIVNVSSSAGLCAVVGQSMYCATKFAVRGFTDTIRQDFGKKYNVLGVYPGFIRTDILSRQKTNDKENKLINKMMMPLSKASKKIVKNIRKRKKNTVMGFDGHGLSIMGRFFPNVAPSLVKTVLKASGLELFEGVFKE